MKVISFVDHRSITILSLCAGVGGIDLGIRMAQQNARTICYVEIEAFACEILATRMEDKTMDEAPIWTDLRTFNSKPWRGHVDCIIGGYPCQPFSVAGKQKGADDPRHLWPNIADIIKDIQPRICFFENVSGHLRLGFEQVHDDLSAMGYKVKTGLFTAAEVGSSHKRERLFIMAYRESNGIDRWLSELYHIQREIGFWDATEFERSGETSLADSACFLSQRPESKGNRQRQPEGAIGSISCELANADCPRFQETRTEFVSTGTCRNNRELGDTKHDGSSSTKVTRGDGKINGTERSTCRESTPEQSSGTNYVANRDDSGLKKQCWSKSIQAQYKTFECGGSDPFPPGPTGEWDDIPTDLKPAICRMADGMANRVDRIRACGNGVVPLVAAYAWCALTLKIIGDRKL